MLNPNPYMALSTALGFSAADLNANRLGVLSPYQREKLSTQRLHTLGWSALLILLLLVGGYFLQAEFIFVVFCGACLITFMIATWQRIQEDLDGHVQVITGQLTQRTLPLGRYAADVNGQTFNLPKHLTNAFNTTTHYRLYYTPGTRTILSAEII
ncbi:MAG: hypothetical protein ABI970_19115 [Chloroflexota bacterium]|nr:hypothetical protein [Anaerolineae bacterium]